MHGRRRLHQSLGPASVLLNRNNEMDVRLLNARLRDLAFAVDVSDEALIGGATLGDIWDSGAISSRPDPRLASSCLPWRYSRALPCQVCHGIIS
jgi:hypothetical protein